MAMSSIGDNKEREQTVDFATYYWNGTLVLVRKGNPKQIQADQACGAHIGVIRGSPAAYGLPSRARAEVRKRRQAGSCRGGLPELAASATGAAERPHRRRHGRRPAAVGSCGAATGRCSRRSGRSFATRTPGEWHFPKGSKLVEPVHDATQRLDRKRHLHSDSQEVEPRRHRDRSVSRSTARCREAVLYERRHGRQIMTTTHRGRPAEAVVKLRHPGRWITYVVAACWRRCS